LKNDFMKTFNIVITVLFCLYNSLVFGQKNELKPINIPELIQSEEEDFSIDLREGDTLHLLGIGEDSLMIEFPSGEKSDTTIVGDTKWIINEGFTKKFKGEISFILTDSSKKVILNVEDKKDQGQGGEGGRKGEKDDRKGENVGSVSMIADVLQLKDSLNRNTYLAQVEITKILRKYRIGRTELIANPYLNSVIPDSIILDSLAENDGNNVGPASTQSGTSDLKKITNKLGGLDVTKFADGLAKFMIKRAKEELTIAFFQDFQDNIKENEEFQLLFPRTAGSLERIGNELYNYQRYLETLREDFYDDLNQLPQHIQRFPWRFPQKFQTKNDSIIAFGLVTGGQIIQGIRNKKHPGNIIEDLDTQGFTAIDTDFDASIKSLKLLSVSLRNPEIAKENRNKKGAYWVDDSLVHLVLTDDVSLKLYLGLLAHEGKAIVFQDGKTLQRYLIDAYPKFREISPVVFDFMIQATEIEYLIRQQDTTLTGRELRSYVDALSNTFQLGRKFTETLNIGIDSVLSVHIDKAFTILQHATRMYTNIQDERFHAAVSNLVILCESIFPADMKANGELNTILKYANFMASMVEAEDSDEVAQVIEAFALPSGSARIKRNTACNISLNGYLGFSGGFNFDKFSGGDAWEASLGVTAPIGVALSTGGKLGSLSLFASFIDIGAVASHRFTNPDSQIAKIYLREIFSPGLMISYGIPKTPLSINCGLQRTAELTEINAQQRIVLESNWRLSAALVVDIPFLNVYSKPLKEDKRSKQAKQAVKEAKQAAKEAKKAAKQANNNQNKQP